MVGWAAPSVAQGETGEVAIDLPSQAERTGTEVDPQGLYQIPAQRFVVRDVSQRVLDGARQTTAWAIPFGDGVGVYPLFQTLAAQIEDQGFTPLLRCGAQECGGFDFRRSLELLPPPVMFLDLAEFYVLTATRPSEDAEEGVMLVVSRTASHVTCQITRVTGRSSVLPSVAEPTVPATRVEVAGPDHSDPSPVIAASDPAPSQESSSFAEQLKILGTAVLEDVSFPPGSSQLDDMPNSLNVLAAFLAANPDRRATIVGHSDSSGSAVANLALSKKRAATVRRLLIEQLGVPADRVSADGVGHLAPRDTNATQEGMARNRRVEVVVN